MGAGFVMQESKIGRGCEAGPQGRLQAEMNAALDGAATEGEAGTDLAERGALFIDVNIGAFPQQRQRRGKAANATPDDADERSWHATKLPCLVMMMQT